MPILTLETGFLNKDQKEELIRELTETAARITGITEKSFIVLLKELDDDNVGVGGQVLTEVKKSRGR